jgi:hypothetical protein
MAGRRSLEVWRTLDGRLLLHQAGAGHDHNWIEVLPEALGWLVERLEEFRIGTTAIDSTPDLPEQR